MASLELIKNWGLMLLVVRNAQGFVVEFGTTRHHATLFGASTLAIAAAVVAAGIAEGLSYRGCGGQGKLHVAATDSFVKCHHLEHKDR